MFGPPQPSLYFRFGLLPKSVLAQIKAGAGWPKSSHVNSNFGFQIRFGRDFAPLDNAGLASRCAQKTNIMP
jgi:hypothetical protein